MDTLKTMLSLKAAKFLVAAAAAVLIVGLTAWQVAMADAVVTPYEWATIAIAVLGAIGVYATRNTPPD